MNIRENYTVNHCKIVRRSSNSLISTNVGGKEETIPIDLLIEIFWRLPVKAIASFRLVSKLWDSLLRHKDFTEPFLTNSSTRPRLLFAFQVIGKWHFFSSIQPQNLGEDLTADYHMSFSGHWYKEVCMSTYGFICLKKFDRVHVICNPSTGQHLTLPKPRARNLDLRSFFGYNPIQKRYKVLCMTVSYTNQVRSKDHQVLTLGDDNLYWRKIECSIPHYPQDSRNGICIDGVLYYIARSNMTNLIACFDLSSEKFSFIEMENFPRRACLWTLMKYKGKVGVMIDVYGSHTELWIREKDKWSKHALPNIRLEEIKSIWATDSGEIAWVCYRWTLPLSVYYYNVEKNCFGRVEVKGIVDKILKDQDRPREHFVFTDHVENVMFL